MLGGVDKLDELKKELLDEVEEEKEEEEGLELEEEGLEEVEELEEEEEELEVTLGGKKVVVGCIVEMSCFTVSIFKYDPADQKLMMLCWFRVSSIFTYNCSEKLIRDRRGSHCHCGWNRCSISNGRGSSEGNIHGCSGYDRRCCDHGCCVSSRKTRRRRRRRGARLTRLNAQSIQSRILSRYGWLIASLHSFIPKDGPVHLTNT